MLGLTRYGNFHKSKDTIGVEIETKYTHNI